MFFLPFQRFRLSVQRRNIVKNCMNSIGAEKTKFILAKQSRDMIIFKCSPVIQHSNKLEQNHHRRSQEKRQTHELNLKYPSGFLNVDIDIYQAG